MKENALWFALAQSSGSLAGNPINSNQMNYETTTRENVDSIVTTSTTTTAQLTTENATTKESTSAKTISFDTTTEKSTSTEATTKQFTTEEARTTDAAKTDLTTKGAASTEFTPVQATSTEATTTRLTTEEATTAENTTEEATSTGATTTELTSERVCIRLTSGYDESLCQHAQDFAGPQDWRGGEITLTHSHRMDDVWTVPAGFTSFEHCIDNVDVANDLILLSTTSGDGVCITGLFYNNNQLLVGQNDNLRSFWIDGNGQYCLDNFMATREIGIRNRRAFHSASCEGDGYG